MQQPFTRRAWLEIDLDQMAKNLAMIRAQLSPPCKVCAVVKADGYGQGAPAMARRLMREGVDFFAVASLLEGVALRDAGIKGEILVLSYTHPSLTGALLDYHLTQAVGSLDYAQELDQAAKAAQKVLCCHIKLDTGMTRTGFDCTTAEQLDQTVSAYRFKNLKATGTFSHFSSADDGSEGADEYCQWQIARFCSALAGLSARGAAVGVRHLCNSGGMQKYPEAHFDMVRCGALLAGYPTACHLPEWPQIRPISALFAAVCALRDIEPGTCVSYSRTFHATKPTRVAVLTIGYADGYPRALSRKGRVMLHGQWANQLGNVCMDQMMVDVTEIPEVQVGDAAMILGVDGAISQSADQLGEQSGSCMHEILSRLGSRLQRLYFENGALTEIL